MKIWKSGGYRKEKYPIKLDQDKLEEIFCSKEHQADVLAEIYALVYGEDWKTLIDIEGHPACNDKTWRWISQRFIEFDSKYHQDVIPGGAWMNKGFAIDIMFEDFEVDQSFYKMPYPDWRPSGGERCPKCHGITEIEIDQDPEGEEILTAERCPNCQWEQKTLI